MLSQVCLVLLALLCALASVALADPARVLVACVANRAAVHNLALVARELQEASGLNVTLAVPAEAAAWPEVNSTDAGVFPVGEGEADGDPGGGDTAAAAAAGADDGAFDRLVRRFSQMVGAWEYAERVDSEVWRSQHMYEPLVEAFNNSDNKPDLMIIDSYTFAAFDVAEALGVPYVVHHAGLLDAPPFARAYVPAHGTGYSIRMRPWERCVNFLIPYLQSLALQPSLRQLNEVRRSRDLLGLSHHFEPWSDTPFIASAALGLEYARPLTASTELVGPLEREAGGACVALPAADSGGSEGEGGSDEASEADISAWLDEPDQGEVLLISGLAALSSALLMPLAEALERSQRPVLWVGDVARRLTYRSPFFRKFEPRDGCDGRFLDHSAISTVFAHCDLHEVHAAVLAGKPTVCLPTTPHQLDVATRLVDAGAGITLPLGRQGDAFASDLKHAIFDATQHSSHQRMSRGVRYLAATMSRAGGVQRAAHLVDSFLALGTDHIAPAPMPWYVSSCLDIYAACGACVLALLVALRAVLWVYGRVLG